MQTASFPSTSGWDGVEASLQTGLVVSLRHTPHCSLLPDTPVLNMLWCFTH